jgi:hypothetical protein
MQIIAGEVGIAYALGTGRTWERFIPQRPELNTLNRLDHFDCLIVRVTDSRAMRWVFDV